MAWGLWVWDLLGPEAFPFGVVSGIGNDLLQGLGLSLFWTWQACNGSLRVLESLHLLCHGLLWWPPLLLLRKLPGDCMLPWWMDVLGCKSTMALHKLEIQDVLCIWSLDQGTTCQDLRYRVLCHYKYDKHYFPCPYEGEAIVFLTTLLLCMVWSKEGVKKG